ncbi:DNA-directed DNA polymerase, partial [Gammaproteobacteria bacterium]|nr:DNA-directed DNA polymerase [Gammaproteobacteria bacterium]
VKLMDSIGLMVECNKLKSFEEKTWVKNQLGFMNESDAKEFSIRITDIFSGNLIAQQNEINILKLTYSENNKDKKIGYDNAEFLPYQLEDKIVELNTKYALRITKSIKKNDDHYGPLLVWIIGKIINTCVGSLQDNVNLEKAGIWKNKIPNYMNFIKKNPLKKMLLLQKKIYELDLASKGLGGMTKDQFWQELDNMVISLTSN